MAKSAAEAIGPDGKLDPVFARALREGLFWLLAALALVLFIALASFDASDRSFAYTGEPGRVGNLIGPLGAWLASALFLLFGWPAFRRAEIEARDKALHWLERTGLVAVADQIALQ